MTVKPPNGYHFNYKEVAIAKNKENYIVLMI